MNTTTIQEDRIVEQPLSTLISILNTHAVESRLVSSGRNTPEEKTELEAVSKCAEGAKSRITLGLAAVGELLWLSTAGKDENGYEFERLGDVGCLIQTLAETLHELDQLQQDADFAIKTPRPFVVGA